MKHSYLLAFVVIIGCASVQGPMPLSSIATIYAYPDTIFADSSSFTRISVSTHGHVADSQTFSLTTDLGRFVGGTGTGNQSISILTTGDSATATLIAGTTPGIAHISALAKGLALSTSVTFLTPPSFTLSLSSSTIPANAISVDTITVQLQPGSLDGQTVSFTTTLGQFITPSGALGNTYQGKTNHGSLKALLASNLQSGIAHVVVTIGALTEYVDVIFTRQYPSSLRVFPSSVIATADGASPITLNVVCNSSDSLGGISSSGLKILVQAQGAMGDAQWLDHVLTTDQTGTAMTTLTSKISGTFFVTASLADMPTVKDTVTLTFK